MASLRVRLSPLMRLLPVNGDSLPQMSKVSAHGSLAWSQFQRVGHQCHQPRTLSSCMKPSPQQTLPVCKPCFVLTLQKLKYSGVPVEVPQVDLEDCEMKTGRSSDHDNTTSRTRGGKTASEILQNLSPQEARRLKIIKLEFDVIEQMNGRVPEVMTEDNWLHALQLDSKSKRTRYYTYLRKVEGLKRNKKRKQEVKQQQREEKGDVEPRDKNTIFFTLRDSTVKKAGNYRLAHAMQFGQPLVFDMDYEQYMRNQDCQNLVFQMLLSYSKNRESRDPFHMVLTSLDPQGRLLAMLRRAKMTGAQFMGTMTQHSYLDLFPREHLVYLSPHAPHPLREVSPDDIYIVGGIVDKTNTQPLSLARAKEQGLRVAKFPLDDYLLWGSGSKSLTLDQVMSILLEQRRTQDWNEAFKVIPQRKLYRDDV